MDFSRFTPEQQACVTCFGRPLVVAAGAGSGKTFMLTQRIAYALLHPELSGVTSIDQILAITFTDKAASEIKARVRSTLRAEGLTEQALAVDSSWISTIHGMCSRILHEHALDLGLDPKFGLLDDTDRTALLRDAINEVIDEVSLREPRERQIGGPGERRAKADEEDGSQEKQDRDTDESGPVGADAAFAKLFAEYENSSGESAVGRMVEALINDAANVSGGLDAALELGPEPESPRDIAQGAFDAMTRFYGFVMAHGFNSKGKERAKFATNAKNAFEDPNGLTAFERVLDHLTITYEDAARVLAEFNPKLGGWSKQIGDESVYVDFRLTYAAACHECALGLARTPLRQLVDLARRAQVRFAAKKRQRNVLDQNDLLLETLRALRENAAGVADEYRDRFRLVMVDEFQDTSQLQIDIISYLDGGAGGEHPHARLCVVGDKQQSIYRFRGADVATYGAFQDELRERCGAQQEQLGKNWRSHGDIIEFVNKVFAQDDVFGTDDFIQLGYDEGHEQSNPFWPDVPRIDIALVTGPSRNGITRAKRRPIEATTIARRFRQLHDGADLGVDAAGTAKEAGGKNRRWGDMVILLGKMTNVDEYAQALRDEGIPCVVAGGSTFGRAPEAQTVCQLASAVANPEADDALGAVLASGMFGLSPDELLRLATRPGGGQRGFWEGLRARAASDPSPRVRLAAAVLREAIERCGRDQASRVLTDAVLASGWLDRLRGRGPAGSVDEQGMAVAANVLKALRLVESFEADPHAPRSMASVAARLRTKFDEGMKEAPGALNATGQNAVRLMTIHASKGLEFPIVALAEFYERRNDAEKLTVEATGNELLASLAPGRSCGDEGAFSGLKRCIADYDDQLKKARAAAEGGQVIACEEDPDDPTDAGSAVQFARAVRRRATTGELAEMRRKAYVGMTRPREALIIAAHPDESSKDLSKDAALLYPDAFDDVRRGVAGADNDLATLAEGYAFAAAFAPERSVRVGCEHMRAKMEKRATVEGETDEVDEAAWLYDVRCGDGIVDDLELEEYLTATKVSSHSAGDEASGANSVGRPAVDGATAGDAMEFVPEYVRIDDLRPATQPAPSAQAGLISYSYLATGHGANASDPDETPAGKRTARPDDSEGDDPAAMADRLDNGDSDDPAATARRPDDAAAPLDKTASSWDPTAFGSAFHAAAQWAIEQLVARREHVADDASSAPSEAALPLPSDERLRALACTWGLPGDALPRLREALALWASSDIAREALAHRRLQAEASIFSHVDGPTGEPLYLTGSIDLLCTDGPASATASAHSHHAPAPSDVGTGDDPAAMAANSEPGHPTPTPAASPAHDTRALIIDYKTGGAPDEAPAQLADKHRLQATCYAYATLTSGYNAVDIAFVRVEQPDPAAPDQPQLVRYHFEHPDTPALVAEIQQAYLVKRALPLHA